MTRKKRLAKRRDLNEAARRALTNFAKGRAEWKTFQGFAYVRSKDWAFK